jgi:hypothetical protein
MSDVIVEDQYSYDKDAYNQLIASFIGNESTRREVETMQNLCPKALNLVRDDWENVLKNSSIFKNWASNKFVLSESIKVPNQYVCYKIPSQYHVKILLVCEILYGVSRNTQNDDVKKVKRHIDIIQSGPIQELVKAFANLRNHKYFNYASVFLPTCNNMHSECNAQSYRKTKTSFCLFDVKLFDGVRAGKVTPIFIESKKLKNFVGIAVLELTGITCFRENFNTIKLSGACKKLLLTVRNCLRKEEFGAEGILFDVDPEGKTDEEREYESHASYLIPDNIVQPFFNNSYQVSKKVKLMIDDK